MLSELRAEKEQVEHAILALERLARDAGNRRGRPPKWLAEANRVAIAPEVKAPRKGAKRVARKAQAVAEG